MYRLYIKYTIDQQWLTVRALYNNNCGKRRKKSNSNKSHNVIINKKKKKMIFTDLIIIVPHSTQNIVIRPIFHQYVIIYTNSFVLLLRLSFVFLHFICNVQ